MEFENEHWRLVITPRYVRKDNTKIKVECPSCKGSGIITDPDAIGLSSKQKKCFYCWGDGSREILPEIPPPPEMDKNFLEDLKTWYENYKPS